MRRFIYLVVVVAVGCAHAGRESLMQADADWARAVAERGTEAWVEGFADDGAMYPAGAPRIVGHDKIGAAMADLGSKLQLRWRPLGAEASADGTFGYTWGSAEIITASGERKTKYVTVWRRVGDQWKVVADMGAPGEP